MGVRCPICGGNRTEQYGVVIVCRSCHCETRPGGVLLGDKIKEKIDEKCQQVTLQGRKAN